MVGSVSYLTDIRKWASECKSLTRCVCHNRKLLILLAVVKEMPKTGWVTKIELIAKVLHLYQS